MLQPLATAQLLLSVWLAILPATDWTRFRGPNGTGVSPDRGLPTEIDRAKNVLWSVKLPKGNSSPIIVNGRVFLTAHEGDQRLVLCYDAATGKQLWRKSILKARTEVFHPAHGPTTPTPTSDGQNVFVFIPEFGLLAYDRNGKELWRTPLGPFHSIQGMASSPVLAGGRLVLLVDTPEEAYLVAFDARTGKQAWRTERPVGLLGSYSTPTVYAGAGESQVVVAGANELTGYLASTGARLWWTRGVTIAPNAPPFIAGDSVYTIETAGITWPPFSNPLGLFDKNKNGRIELAEATSDSSWFGSLKSVDKHLGNNDGAVTEDEYVKTTVDESQGGGLVRLRLGGKGDVSRSVMWRQTKGLPSLTGALLYQNVLYTIRSGILALYDPETGNLLRQERMKNALGDYYASPIAADDKLYLVSHEGKVTVLKAGAEAQIISTGELGEEVVATPSIAAGRVYLRTEGTLFCFGTGRR